jgi:hypothetical protein
MVEHSGVEPLASTMPWRRIGKPRVPRGPTVELAPSKKYVIPAGFSLVPAIDWSGDRPKIFHVLCENGKKECGKSVAGRRRRRGAS